MGTGLEIKKLKLCDSWTREPTEYNRGSLLEVKVAPLRLGLKGNPLRLNNPNESQSGEHSPVGQTFK